MDKVMIDKDPLEEFLEKEKRAMEHIENLERRTSSTSPRSSIGPVSISPILAMSPTVSPALNSSASQNIPTILSPRSSISKQESEIQRQWKQERNAQIDQMENLQKQKKMESIKRGQEELSNLKRMYFDKLTMKQEQNQNQNQKYPFTEFDCIEKCTDNKNVDKEKVIKLIDSISNASNPSSGNSIQELSRMRALIYQLHEK